MKLVDFHSNIPKEQVALDEILLLKAENEGISEMLRFWIPEKYFIVLGRSSKAKEDCYLDNCSKNKIEIIRRTSGGGTILQGEGCLNYSLILSYDSNSMYKDIKKSYFIILDKICKQFQINGIELKVFSLSDIALDNKKVSGNAQSRKKKYFLQHGTFLCNFDINKISSFLKHPPKEPVYRQKRSHEKFLINLPISLQATADIIKKTFSDSGEIYSLTNKDKEDLKELVNKKYSSDDWNFMF